MNEKGKGVGGGIEKPPTAIGNIRGDNPTRRGFKDHIPYFSLSTILHLLLILLFFPVFIMMPSQPGRGKITTMNIVITQDDQSDVEAGREEKKTPSRKTKSIKPALKETNPEEVDDEGFDEGVEGTDYADLGEGGATNAVGGEGAKSAILNRYIMIIRDRIEKKKRYPRAARVNNEEGTATVSFLLDSSGSVVVAKVVLSSGYETLDNAALNTILSASPYPPIPNRLKRKNLNLKVPIKYELR